VNLARHLDVDADAALRATNAKFERRFRSIEAALARHGKIPAEATLAEMDALWDEAKAAECPAQDASAVVAKRART
jgi:ATP diphosphatase